MKDKDVEGFSFSEVFDDGKSCDRESDLFRYFESRLSADGERDFEEHLRDCSICSRRLAALQREEEAIQSTDLDLNEARRIFDQGRTSLQAALDVKYPAKRTAMRFPGGFRLPAYANALALLLLAVLVYPAYRGLVLDRELERAQADLAVERAKDHGRNTDAIKQAYDREIQRLKEERRELSEPALSGSAVYPARLEREGRQKTIIVEFSAGKRSFNLVFALPPGDFQSFVVEILQDSTTVWRKETGADAASPVLSLFLQADYFKTGDYLLRVSGKRGGDTTLAAEYHLKIIRAE